LKHIKRYFFTGLVLILPVFLTLWIAKVVLSFVTKPFIGWITSFLERFEIVSPALMGAVSQFLGFLLFLGLLFVIGYLGRTYLAYLFFKMVDLIFHRIPFVNKIYKATQDVVHNLFHEDAQAFKTVVLVPYPHKGILSIGLVTADSHISRESQSQELISVFIPATPNPTVGFVLLFERKDIIITSMTVRQALQLVVSCGSKIEPFDVVPS